MIDLTLEVTIKWLARNKKYYENLGYKYTKINDTFNVSVKDLKVDSSAKVTVYCDDCGIELLTPYRNYNKIVNKSGAYRCRKCNAPYVSDIRINNNKEKELKKFNKYMTEHGYVSLATEDDYIGYDNPMPFICPIHGKQKLSIKQINQGIICIPCANLHKLDFNKHDLSTVKNMIESKNNNTLLNPEDYVNIHTKNLRVVCGSCGEERLVSLSSIVNSNGMCHECSVKRNSGLLMKSKSLVIAETTRDGEVCILNPDDYTGVSVNNLKFKCVSCGNIFTRSLTHWRQGDGRCTQCHGKISEGELIIMEYLDDKCVNYTHLKRFPDCKYKKTLPFDFYLDDYNCCIEFDGPQHEKMAKYDTIESFLLRQLRDKIKDEYCEQKNIKLIRIRYTERKNIKNILDELLNIV